MSRNVSRRFDVADNERTTYFVRAYYLMEPQPERKFFFLNLADRFTRRNIVDYIDLKSTDDLVTELGER